MQTIDTQAGKERGGQMCRIKVTDVLSADMDDIFQVVFGALVGFMAGLTWAAGTVALFSELALKFTFFFFPGSIAIFLGAGANKFICLKAAFISVLGGFVTIATANIIILSVAVYFS